MIIQYGRTHALNLNKAKTNWCPGCRQYTKQNHACSKLVVPGASEMNNTANLGRDRGDVPPAGAPGATSPPIGEVMATKKAATKKSNGHRKGLLYKALAKLGTTKLKGQAEIVAKALTAFTTPKDLETLTAKAKDFGLKTKTPIADSVHYHLRRFVADSLATESKVEAASETTATA